MIALAILLLTTSAQAEPDDRILGGHTFQVPSEVVSPFPQPAFGLRQGIGYLRIPDVTFEGYRTPVDLSLVGAVETLEVAVAPAEGLAVDLRATGEITGGIDPDSAYFGGARAGYAAELGVTRRLLRSERHATVLSVRGDLRARGGYALTPFTLVGAILEERERTLEDILRGQLLRYVLARERGLTGGATLSLARALGPRMGLQASATLRAGRASRSWFEGREERTRTSTRVAGHAGVAVGARPLVRVPVALQLEVGHRVEADRLEHAFPVRGRSRVALGTYYAGRTNLQLGAVLATLLRRGGEGAERMHTAELALRYFF